LNKKGNGRNLTTASTWQRYVTILARVQITFKERDQSKRDTNRLSRDWANEDRCKNRAIKRVAGQANVMWTPLTRRAKEDGRGRSKVKDLWRFLVYFKLFILCLGQRILS
jgi:hypothetical protein